MNKESSTSTSTSKSKSKSKGRAGRTNGTTNATTADEPSYVVGIGGSAGSLEPIERFFRALRPDTTMSFVIVTHRDPRTKEMMPEILRRFTTMQVCEAAAGAMLERGVVYVVPSQKQFGISGGHIVLNDRPADVRAARSPIDSLFKAIAADRRERSVGVVLSGMGSDGTEGLTKLKESNGLALVQDPSTSAFDAMPRSAIAAGLAHFVGAPESLANALDAFAARAATIAKTPPLEAVLLAVRARTGHDFSQYKKNTLRRRLERRMNLLRIADIPHYLTLLTREPEEIDRLLGDLLIGVTRFFRDPEVFEALKRDVIPLLLEGRTAEHPLRAWVAGCATGEEAYSLAIAIRECWEERHLLQQRRGQQQQGGRRQGQGQSKNTTAHELKNVVDNANTAPLHVQIYATDLDRAAITCARRGIYDTKTLAADVSPERLARHFVVEDGAHHRVNKSIRDMVVFATQNLVSDAPFTKLDILSCRNVLIYLEPELQRKILPVFLYALRPTGFLVLGASEGVMGFEDSFKPFHGGDLKIFERSDEGSMARRTSSLSSSSSSSTRTTKTGVLSSTREEKTTTSKKTKGMSGSLVNGKPNPNPNINNDDDVIVATHEPSPLSAAAAAVAAGRQQQQQQQRRTLPDLLQQTVIEEVAPPVIVVDKTGALLYASRPTGRYFQLAAGAVSTNVFAMAREGLMLPLRAGLRKAFARGARVTQRGVRVRTNGHDVFVDLSVLPIRAGDFAGNALIAFAEATAAPRADGKKSKTSKKTTTKKTIANDRAALVRLRETKAQLDALMFEMQRSEEAIKMVNDELQSANEELQSTNEELQSTNEELTTSKEEMQSMNEELLTLNAELQTSNEQLATTNDDMRNLLNSSKIPTLFLDNELRLKRYTAEGTRIARLISSDVGRPITDLVWSLRGYTTLARDVKRVLDTLSSMEREVVTEDGATYTMQVHPYRTIDDIIDGVVITFMDITAQKHQAEVTKLEERSRLLRRTIRRWPGVAWVEDVRTRRSLVVSAATERLFGYPHKMLKAVTEDFWQKLRRKGLRLKHADGTIARYQEHTVALASDSPQGEPTHVLHFFRQHTGTTGTSDGAAKMTLKKAMKKTTAVVPPPPATTPETQGKAKAKAKAKAKTKAKATPKVKVKARRAKTSKKESP